MGSDGNTIAMAILATLFVTLGVTFLSDELYHADVPETFGYAIEGGELEADTGGGDSGPAYDPIAPLLASVDVAVGEKAARKCAACHTFNEGGENKSGPPLYGIVNRAIASAPGFGYSSALKAYAEGGKTWTYDELNGFLFKPKDHVKGTSMGFAGLKKTDERAGMIAYLRSLAATPAPLPDPAAAPAGDDAAAAEGGTEDKSSN